MKAQGKILGFKPLAQSYKLDVEQLSTLDHVRAELKNKNWEECFAMLKKGKKYQESCELLKVSTFQSKRILDTLHHDHYLWESLMKVYSIFIQTIEDDDEGLNTSNMEKTSDKEALQRKI